MTSELIQSRIAAVRAKHVLIAVCTGVAMAVALIVVWTGITMWLDWHAIRGLPRWGRALSLALELAAVAAIIVTRIIQPIMHTPDDEDIALMIEHEWPDFQTRLIASVQLTRPAAMAALVEAGSGRSLVGAMVKQAEELADQTPLTDVIKTKALNRAGIIAGVCVALAVFLFMWNMPASGALLTRVLLGNATLPTKTHIESVTGDSGIQYAALGDPFTIEAKVSGYKPAAGTLEITYASGRTQKLPMDRTGPASDTYAITLDSIQESFKYGVVIYDGASPDDFSLVARERPSVASLDCKQVYPAYTGITQPVPCPNGDLVVLRGSTLQIKVLATKNLRPIHLPDQPYNYAVLYADKVPTKIELTTDPKNHRLLTGNIPATPTLANFAIHLVDEDGLESKDTALYPVEVLPDHPPTVKITNPDRKEVLQTAIAKFEVGFLAEDDYQLGKLTLHYKVVDDEKGSILSIPIPLPKKYKSWSDSYLWDLSKIPAPAGQPSLEGSVVEYWLDVEDTCTPQLGGPGKGASEHYAVRVVSAAAKQAELLARSGQTVGDIKDAEEHQNQSADNTAREIHGGAAPATKPNQP